MKHERSMNTNAKKVTEKEKKSTMSSMAFFLYSMIAITCGGLFLTYWFYKYHPTNSNLWMVPLGLLFLLTPAFLSLSVLISDLCDDDDGESRPKPNQDGDVKV
ncbi:unnamed protein product [Microthlaspi erraticum]|uniref:Uncharacterized protein n=1 Tax=Microthlaspi erraticum TaxID=1685480 RepID=A0A6D2KSD3_9BRAS|nr:unnamed protein product [Microthlaspi erraticum]